MLEVNFYETNEIENSLLKFAVIASKYQDKWIFCKHKDRDTWEIPGGRREIDEAILNTAKRELFEETGAKEFEITPICVYSVKRDDESFANSISKKILEELSMTGSNVPAMAQNRKHYITKEYTKTIQYKNV